MTRVYAVGHSSAGTVALQVAEHEPRIAACVAFAPATEVMKQLSPYGAQLDKLQPGEMDFMARLAPDRNIDKLKCPTMLFTARDDDNVPSASVARFAAALQKTNDKVKLVTVDTGGHHQSMIKEGIPAAIEWLKALPAAPAAK
jgi:dipeptidyl aminopeptidase/acylaminoacyl peptidase